MPTNGNRRVGSAAGTSEGRNSNSATEVKPQPDSTQALGHDNSRAPVLWFSDRATADAFSARVVAAVLEAFPQAFEQPEGAAP